MVAPDPDSAPHRSQTVPPHVGSPRNIPAHGDHQIIIPKDMPRPRSKNPLTAAITAVLKPALLPLGFGPIGGRAFGRINDHCILHYVGVALSAWGGKDFWIEYAILTLVQPHNFIYLTWGERLHSSTGTDWKADSHESADRSITEALAAIRQAALPHFNTHGSPPALLEQIRTRESGADHHQHFEIGALQAWLKQTTDAKRSLRHAAKLYDQDHRSWTMDYKRQVETLLAAIDAGTHHELQLRWIDHCINTLRLQKVHRP